MSRFIRQPGPAAPQRVVAVAVGAVPIVQTLPAGVRLLDALAALLPACEVESACLQLSGGAFGPFAYVIPSLPPDPSHAAFYSDVVRPPGQSALEAAAVTLGFREGRPFFHCHALWAEANGRPGCGHVLPDETWIAEAITVEGRGLVGARFEVHPDAETGFSLFAPRPTGTTPPPGAEPGIAFRLAPNQELTPALESMADAAGFRRARLHGGVASIIEARFTDADPITGFATELLLLHGSVRGKAADPEPTTLHVAIVDYRGALARGRLVNGDNPVLMTFEGLMTAEGAS